MEGINEVIGRIERGLKDRGLDRLTAQYGGWKAGKEISLKHENGKLHALWSGTILKTLPLPAAPRDSHCFAMDFVELVPTST